LSAVLVCTLNPSVVDVVRPRHIGDGLISVKLVTYLTGDVTAEPTMVTVDTGVGPVGRVKMRI